MLRKIQGCTINGIKFFVGDKGIFQHITTGETISGEIVQIIESDSAIILKVEEFNTGDRKLVKVL